MNKCIEDIRGITAKQWKTALTFGALKAFVFVSLAIIFSEGVGAIVGAPDWAIAFFAMVLTFQFLVIFDGPWGNYEPTT